MKLSLIMKKLGFIKFVFLKKIITNVSHFKFMASSSKLYLVTIHTSVWFFCKAILIENDISIMLFPFQQLHLKNNKFNLILDYFIQFPFKLFLFFILVILFIILLIIIIHIIIIITIFVVIVAIVIITIIVIIKIAVIIIIAIIIVAIIAKNLIVMMTTFKVMAKLVITKAIIKTFIAEIMATIIIKTVNSFIKFGYKISNLTLIIS